MPKTAKAEERMTIRMGDFIHNWLVRSMALNIRPLLLLCRNQCARGYIAAIWLGMTAIDDVGGDRDNEEKLKN
jgi:hypothetical protein